MSEIKDKESWHGHTNAEVENYIKNRLDNSAGCKKILYAELKELRDNGKLIPGMQYRITDYQCTTTEKDTRSAGHQFDIIVTADDEKTLNENVRAVQHEGDEYFLNSNLAAWELKYCLDNNTERFAWANEDIYIKSIYINLEPSSIFTRYSPGDRWKMSRFYYCWKSETGTCIWTTGLFVQEKEEAYFSYDENDSEHDIIVLITKFETECSKGVIYYMKDEWNNECPYDFKNIMFNRPLTNGEYDKNGTNTWVYTFNAYDCDNSIIKDASLLNTLQLDDAGCRCKGNVIKEYNFAYTDKTFSMIRLNDIVFLNKYSLQDMTYFECYSNIFGNCCWSHTFGNYCYCNIFGCFCWSNIFGNGCSHNTFGNECNSNTFSNVCVKNTFGNNCWSDTFGNDCYLNTFSSDCWSNTFGNNCSGNTFSNGGNDNTFGNDCSNKHLEHTSNCNIISGNIPEFWFNNEKW